MPDDIFITDDFLLGSETAKTLYHDHAADQPIIDFHCHLPPREIAEDTRWENITEVWLHHDHYKWRTMRSNGIDERYCTGDASDREKFEKFAATMPYLPRNPMYDWCHLELKNYFGITEKLLCPETAGAIYDRCAEVMQEGWFSARGLMTASNVVCVCTTDDPADSLEHHEAIAADDGFAVGVYPTWRPDMAMAADRPREFNAWLDRLRESSGVDVADLDSFFDALGKRQDVFAAAGCRLSDHAVETVPQADCTRAEAAAVFAGLLAGTTPSPEEVQRYCAFVLHELCCMNHEKEWVQQLHIGALRNNNRRLFRQLGRDVGCDSISDRPFAPALSALLGRLDEAGALAPTIIYNLNPKDNEMIGAMIGNFQDGSRPGKIQYGAAWWFLDQVDGMTRQIDTLSRLGLLRRFVGMVTDSRSFLSYARHEYFRRLLCDIIGGDIEAGRMPRDMDLAAAMVREISCGNAAAYFRFPGVS